MTKNFEKVKAFLFNRNNILSPDFWTLTLVKLIIGTFFASDYVTLGFLPFVEQFISHGNNPYNIFFDKSQIVFPYPSGMLLILSSFLSFGEVLFSNIFSQIHLALFFTRIPILLADIAIFVFLCKLLPSKEKKVFWLYYASPILFYINYFHGQLDVIPTAFLFLSLYFLSSYKLIPSFISLGIGVAVKTHLLVAFPFYIIYLLRRKVKITKVLFLTILSVTIFLLINLPFFSHQFFQTVFNNPEQQRMFYTSLYYQYRELSLLLAPASILICFYFFATKKRQNFDSVILMLALVFTILIALVPPMQGWFYWSIPLLVYFLIKYESRLIAYYSMNVFFILFYIFIKNSDIFESAATIFPTLTAMPTPFVLLQQLGMNALLIQNLLFTCLQVVVVLNAYLAYRMGVYYNNLYIERQKAFILGIGGDSGVGKSTFTDGITDLVGEAQIVVLNGDDSHRWERKNKNWQYFTHLDPKANKLHKDIEHIYALIDGKSIERVNYNHANGQFSRPQRIENNQFIVFQGLHPFFLGQMRKVYDVKIFIEADEILRRKWKLQRDILKRGKSRKQTTLEIKRRKKDASKYIRPQKELADWIISYRTDKDILSVRHVISNSIPFDTLISELKAFKNLSITHEYTDMNVQELYCKGKISGKALLKIAYKLYPNLAELINYQPHFRDNIEGINQIAFINILSYYFLNKRAK